MIKEPSKRLNASLHLIIIIWTNFNCPFPASLLKLNSGLNGQMFDHHLVSSFPANNSPTLGGLYKLIYCNDFILCFANYCLQGRTHILHALGIEILLFTASLAHGGWRNKIRVELKCVFLHLERGSSQSVEHIVWLYKATVQGPKTKTVLSNLVDGCTVEYMGYGCRDECCFCFI